MHASIIYAINGWGSLMSLMESAFLFSWADMFLALLPFLRCLECEKRGPPFYGLGALWFNVWCVLSEPLSLSITLYEPITQSPVLHPAPPTSFFFFSLSAHIGFSLLLLLLLPRPRWALIGLLGIKTWSLGEERDIWEQDGKGDGGHLPTWSPSSGSVETVATRRWVIFPACVQHPAVQHLWILS